MAISFVGSSFVANGLAAGTSATLPRPGGTADGDRLLAFISIGHNGAIGAPAGWTEVPLTDVAFGTLQSRIYTKVANAEPASWVWTFSSAAYVGIAHATRGVGGIFAADQDDDGISLLVHTTPTLPAPSGAWLVSSWTGRNLLALGWSPPAGDTERQDVVGGLLILLNVNHAVDDTNGPVAAGSYSKSAATLVAVRAFDALVVLAPTLDPVQLQSLKAPVVFGDVRVQRSIELPEGRVPVSFGDVSVGHTLTLTHILSPRLFGVVSPELSVVVGQVDVPASYGIFGVDSELVLEPLLGPLGGLSDLTLEHELQVDAALKAPDTFDPPTVNNEVELLPDLFAPVTISEDFTVLPEQTLLLGHLPIPILPGSGFVWGLMLFQTFLADTGIIDATPRFGTVYVYTEQPYGGICRPD